MCIVSKFGLSHSNFTSSPVPPLLRMAEADERRCSNLAGSFKVKPFDPVHGSIALQTALLCMEIGTVPPSFAILHLFKKAQKKHKLGTTQ